MDIKKLAAKTIKNPSWVSKTPIITTILLEWANISQMIRMWTEKTAEGQSLIAWLSVQFALWLWLNFYLVFTPDQKFAIWGTRVGLIFNWGVIATIIWFRYIGG